MCGRTEGQRGMQDANLVAPWGPPHPPQPLLQREGAVGTSWQTCATGASPKEVVSVGLSYNRFPAWQSPWSLSSEVRPKTRLIPGWKSSLGLEKSRQFRHLSASFQLMEKPHASLWLSWRSVILLASSSL